MVVSLEISRSAAAGEIVGITKLLGTLIEPTFSSTRNSLSEVHMASMCSRTGLSDSEEAMTDAHRNLAYNGSSCGLLIRRI